MMMMTMMVMRKHKWRVERGRDREERKKEEGIEM